jgi:hypothetical protein
MNKTEERVVHILTSRPRSNMPWVVPMQAVARTMMWTTDRTRFYVESLMHKRCIVLKTDSLYIDAAGPESKGQFWWERGELLHRSARKL